jgi:hypothetical protein
MERLIEGIQDFEKIRILRKEFSDKKANSQLKQLEATLALFTTQTIWDRDAMTDVANARKLLNNF